MGTMALGWGTIAALLAWSGFVFWLGRMTAGREARDLSGPPPAFSAPPRPSADLAPDRLAAIRSEIARGNKINAIKLMREATGIGLAEAKQAVEAMEG